MKKAERNGIITDIEMKQRKYKLLYGGILTFMILFVVILCVIPLLWICLAGFKNPVELYEMPVKFFPKEIKLSKLWDVWIKMKIYKSYLNTFIMAAGCIISTVVINGLAGYSLSKLKPKGSGIITKIVFWLMLVPSTVSTVPLYMTFKDFTFLHISLLDTFWPIWIMAGANAFNIILFKSFFDGISTSLIEAARIDGATDISIFIKIMVPLSQPIFLVVSLFTFMGSFGQFFWPNLLFSKENMTVIGLQLYKLKTSTYTVDYQILALLFTIIPTFTLFAIFQNQMIAGMNIGGVKG